MDVLLHNLIECLWV